MKVWISQRRRKLKVCLDNEVMSKGGIMESGGSLIDIGQGKDCTASLTHYRLGLMQPINQADIKVVIQEEPICKRNRVLDSDL